MSQVTISNLALVISASALGWTILSAKRQRQEGRALANLAHSIAVERQLAEVPEALRFHGIDPSDLAAVGITPEEFAYLINSFTVGRIYYSGVYPNRRKPFRPGTYRYKMCQSPDTRKAWPLLREMLAASNYRDAVDATIELLNIREASATAPSKDGRETDAAA